MPAPRRRLLPGLWATAAPASASIRRSSSSSQMECAPTKPGPSTRWSASRATMLLPQRRRLSTTWTLDSARWVWMPTPYSRDRAAQPSSSSSVAWFGMVGATATRIRPSALPCQRRMARSVRSSRPLVGAGRMSSTVRRRSGGRRSLEARDGLVEDDVGHRGGQDHADPDVGVGLHHRREGLVGDRGHRDVEIVGPGAARLEHLDGADGRREVLVVRRAKSRVCGRVGQQILEREAPDPSAGQVAGRVGVGIAHAGEHDAVGGLDHPGAGRSRQARAQGGDTVALDEDVRPLERRR